MRALPAYMKVVILLRSSGGAHFASMAAIEGYVTAYEHARDLLESSMDPARRSDGQTEPRHSPFPVLLQHRSNVYLSFSISNYLIRIFLYGSIPPTPLVFLPLSNVYNSDPKSCTPARKFSTQLIFNSDKQIIVNEPKSATFGWLDVKAEILH